MTDTDKTLQDQALYCDRCRRETTSLEEVGIWVVEEENVTHGWVHEESLAKYRDPDDRRQELRVFNEDSPIHRTRVMIVEAEDE